MNIPSERGPFSFGPPYNTLGIRVTDERDGDILPRTYAYWQNINAYGSRRTARVFLGTSKGPQFWDIDLHTHEVNALGPIFPPDHALSRSTTEGWYWDLFDSDVLYCTDDLHLYRFHVESASLEVVVDISPFMEYMEPHALRQWHSSMERHSATALKVTDNGPWPKLGTVVYDEAWGWNWFPVSRGKKLDESQLDKSGRWLVIKEDDDNRIINLETNGEYLVTDKEGAAGHSDNGYEYIVGADNWQQLATWRVRDFTSNENYVVYESTWDDQVLHVSHCNAEQIPTRIQQILGSGQCRDLIMISLDGSMRTRHVAPSMCTYPSTDIYDYLPKANLDVYGHYALWTRFDGQRFDAFMVCL